MTEDRPLRVLHCLHQFARAGVETWLIQAMRRIDRQRVAMDVLVHTDEPGAYDEEARALGARVLPCLAPAQPWRYGANFRRLVREHGPYDVMHCHLGHWCGVVLRLAAGAGMPVRIAHSRLADRPNVALSLAGRGYRWQMGRWLDRYATHRLAVSHAAGESLFGADWLSQANAGLFRSAIDLGPFREPVDRSAVRRSLGLPAGALVVGHVGRFARQKNHAFLLQVFQQVLHREPAARLLLVGDGPLREEVAMHLVAMGLSEHVVVLPTRPDVARLMRGAMDVFVLPSLHEGLPRVGLEAQAAGLPVVASDTITEELAVVPGRVHRMSLHASAAEWARRVLAVAADCPADASERALAVMGASAFNIDRNVEALVALYESACQRMGRACGAGGREAAS